MGDTLKVFGTTYSNVAGVKGGDGNNTTYTYVRPTGTLAITSNGTVDVTQYASASVAVEGGGGTTINNQATTVSPTESVQNVTYDSGYTGLSTVTVNAIPTTYVGTGVATKASADLTASGATVTAPAGYYAAAATKSVASGTEGTPTASKGSVSNHSITVTPSVTNSAGYIAGGTKTGTAVTVDISELANVYASKLSRNQQNLYVPDDSYADLYAIWQNMRVEFFVQDSDYNVASQGFSSNAFHYSVTHPGALSDEFIMDYYSFTSSGVTKDSSYTFYYPYLADATAADVLPGKVFYTSTGYTEGAMTTVAGATITPSESIQTAVASNKYTTGDVKVAAIPTTYVGSGIATKSSSDLTVSNATVTAPAGYYSAAATKAVASGSVANPVASKGAVSNNTIVITPTVVTTAGYISGGTLTGSTVSVSASQVVSGTTTISANGTVDVSNYASAYVNVPAYAEITQDSNGYVVLPTTATTAASGGGSASLLVTTGTFTGNASNTVAIPCSFEPLEIYIYTTEISQDASLRGVVAIDIIKDTFIDVIVDGSTNNTDLNLYTMSHDIDNYNQNNTDDETYASYSNGTLTINTVVNSTSIKFTSGITYKYKLIGGYTLQQTDSIPLNTELIDFAKVTSDTAINSTGEATSAQYYCTSDYTPVDPSMTFTYIACRWYYIGVYDSNKEVLRTIYVYNDATTVSQDNTNMGQGTLSGNKLLGAAYVRLTGSTNTYISLIRTE